MSAILDIRAIADQAAQACPKCEGNGEILAKGEWRHPEDPDAAWRECPRCGGTGKRRDLPRLPR